jgi:phage terminase Nu1 subunit (DNA packaging protein)
VDPPQDPPNRGFTAARTRREEQQAVLAELDVRKRTGELVEWSKVEAMNASTAVMVRESLLAIPDRLAAVLAAETDERRVRQLLDSELRTALASLAASLKKPA